MTWQSFPAALQLKNKQVCPVSLGCSGDQVWQVFGAKQTEPFAYLKQASHPYALSQLRQERDVLLWLKANQWFQSEQVPEVLNYLEHDQTGYLLSSALKGPGAHVQVQTQERPQHLKKIALALKHLHQIPLKNCPFEASLEIKLKQAKTNWLAGRVDQSDFDDQRLGTPTSELYQRLLAQRPLTECLVFTHGDACLPNLLLSDPPGWIDWSRAGLADPWQDLALLCRSLRHNGYQQSEIELALGVYGVPFDAAAYDYYTLLDEFF